MPEVEVAQTVATLCFGLAIIHTFLVKRLQHMAERHPSGSIGENFYHLFGEIEVVFGFWAAIYIVVLGLGSGFQQAAHYLERLSFTEPAFVFVIMVICATRPILDLASRFIGLASRILPFRRALSFYISALVLGPLLGSFITEPAAMTVTALILLERFYQKGVSLKLKYATLGLLFVNVSIGGTLTPYAAPPVLMVASAWNWDLAFVFLTFGWKGALSCVLSTSFVAWRFRQELSGLWPESGNPNPEKSATPLWLALTHLIFLVAVVASSHHMTSFIGVFLFFLGLVTVTREYQDGLKLREGLLVAFFLGGLVTLGAGQRWWLEPILTRLDALPMYVGAIGLTSVTDNAALTYLGSRVPALGDFTRYALVSGSVVGGGLTVIANAPNPAGYGILNESFGAEGISPARLFISALFPTFVAAACFWFL